MPRSTPHLPWSALRRAGSFPVAAIQLRASSLARQAVETSPLRSSRSRPVHLGVQAGVRFAVVGSVGESR